MPRIARVVIPDVPYHVTQRGNYRQDVFEDQQDKEFYMELFMYYAKEHGLKLYAWCLMDNHVHFVVELSTETTLAKVFNTVHMRYSQYFNKTNSDRHRLSENKTVSVTIF
jgi:putative transposase